MYEIVVATDSRNGIGHEGKLPWWLPEDMRRFRELTQCPLPSEIYPEDSTQANIVIMGRKTWESIHPDRRPLKGRTNIILSRSITEDDLPSDGGPDKVYIVSSFASLHILPCLQRLAPPCRKFVIGGASIYRHFLFKNIVSRIHMTRICGTFVCDTFFPDIHCGDTAFFLDEITDQRIQQSTPDVRSQTPDVPDVSDSQSCYEYRTYTAYHPAEGACYSEASQYQDMVRHILETGSNREDRTGIGTLSLFGVHMRYDLERGFPLLTTKKMYMKAIVEELLWFLRGDTDAKQLEKKGVNIWKGNSSREYLDSIGLKDNREGDCGPIYGFAFRHFGAEYVHCDADYTGQGYDQVAEVLRLIREEPTSRRIMISLWNPCDLGRVALPPCHVLYQFYVEGDYLSCSLYQRSGDMGLGVPFNIASASLMTYIFAHLTGKRPKTLVHTIGDAHIYKNHVAALGEQVDRRSYPFPRLDIRDRGQTTVEDYCREDFSLRGYDSHASIKMKMAI